VARAFAAAGDRVAAHYGASRDKAETVTASLHGDGHVIEDVAAAVLFLACPGAEMASGTVVDVNGASYLRM
jgi:3-oxoacyl-[acyl-carrier protein] reductase